MYNKVILMGRICHDLEVKTTPNGVSVLSFRIAVERSYQVKGEDRKTDFFNVVAWRNNADFISRYFFKGRMILIDGELQTRQYVDKNNVSRDIVEIIVDSANFTGEPKPQQGNKNAHQSNQHQNNNQNNSSTAPSPVPQDQSMQQTFSAGGNFDSSFPEDIPSETTDDDYPF
jgi:single-strand DNA-binding protein